MARLDLARSAIEHLLGSLEPTELSPDDFDVLDAQYGLSAEQGHDLRLQLWREALHTFCSDRVFTPGESLYLIALGDAFGLPGELTEPLRLQAAATQFRAELGAVVADRSITPSERLHLDAVASGFEIPLSQAHDAVENTARGILARLRAQSSTGRVLSRAGVEWFRASARDLGVVLSPMELEEVAAAEAHWSEVDRVLLERTRERDADLERARLRQESELTRLRTAIDTITAVRVIPDGDAFSQRDQHLCEPAALLGWRPHPTNRFEPGTPTLDDVGYLVLTARDLVFDGARVSRRVNLADITAATTHPDGIVIDRSRDPSLRFGVDCAERAILVSVALRVLKGWGPVPHDARSFAELGLSPRR